MPKKTKKRHTDTRDSSSSQDILQVDDPEPQSTQDQPQSQDLFATQEEDVVHLDDGGADDEESDRATEDNQKVPTKKARRDNYTPLKPGEELDLAEWYQQHPQLYNRKMSEYRDTSKKNRLYQEKAAELDIPVDRLRKWVENMRTRYGKLCERHSSGDGASDDTLLSSRDQWILHHLGFLKSHIVRCPTRKSQALVSNTPVRHQQTPPSSSDTVPTPVAEWDEEHRKDSELYRQLEETSKVQRVELEQLREALTKVNKAETEIERVARSTGSYVADVIRGLPLAQAVRIRHKIVDLLQQVEMERMHTSHQPTYPPYHQQYQPQYQGDLQQWVPSAPPQWASTPASHQAPHPSTSGLNLSGLGLTAILGALDEGPAAPTAQLVSAASTSTPKKNTPKKTPRTPRTPKRP